VLTFCLSVRFQTDVHTTAAITFSVTDALERIG
jgi:hypothetical protein